MGADDTDGASKVILCEHWSEQGDRRYGWHRHRVPTRATGNLDGDYPYRVSVGGQTVAVAILECRGRIEVERLLAAAEQARAECLRTTAEWRELRKEIRPRGIPACR